MATRAKARVEAVGGCATLNVKPLRAAVGHVAAVAARGKDAVPVLAGALLTSGPSTMTLTATDLDAELSCQIDLAESGTGAAMAAVVNAATLEKILSKLPKEGQVSLRENGNTALSIVSGAAHFDLPTLPTEAFPTIAPDAWDAEFEMPKTDLQALINAVRFAVSTEEVRYYLNGIFLQAVVDGPEAGRLIAAATDGHRLARYHVPLPDNAQPMPEVILPRRIVAVLDRLLDSAEGATVNIAISTGQMRFEIGAVTLITKLIDGQFPDYRRVIPPANDKAVWLDPKSVVAAIERVTTVASDRQRALKLSLDKDLLTLEVSSPERGTAREEVAVNYDGEPLSIGFNGGYLAETLRHLTADPALVKFSDPAAPTLFIDSEDSQRTYVVMPVRI